jgi:prepilin-type N-terminal cleavage/methylation domain-containing protein
MKDFLKVTDRAFTLIELLVVVSIIGLLASIIFASLSSARSKALTSKVQQEQQQIVKAIMAARINTGQTLTQITGSGCSECVCRELPDLRNIAIASTCYTSMLSAFTKVDTASGGMLKNFLNNIRDPWGSPYLWDENEGENVALPCSSTDNIFSAGPDGAYIITGSPSVQTDNIRTPVPFSLTQCGG